MGCDIHVHIEVQKDGVWHHFAAPKIRRDYFLFAVIAGERADLLRNSDKITPVAKVHRLPGDISLVTRVSVEQDKRLGIHNFGVLSAADLIELQNQLLSLIHI